MICEVCLSELKGPILDLGRFPLCDDLHPIKEGYVATSYSQTIKLCGVCLTAHQLYPVPKIDLFKPSYHYRSALTNDVLLGMKDLAESTLSRISFPEKIKVLDIGCNDGSLLQIFKELSDCTTVGVDPTDAIDDAIDKVDYCFKNFFDLDLAIQLRDQFGTFDVITFTNVFAHIEDLPFLLKSLKLLIGKNTTLVIENHYLGSILNLNQFDTFYHEHPRTYSFESFKYIAGSLGLGIADAILTKRYGGNIRVTFQDNEIVSPFSSEDVFENERDFVQKFGQLNEIYHSWKIEARRVLNEILIDGPILGKSLPGRAVMLIHALGVSQQEMQCVSEKPGSPKIGHNVPGTKIEIRNDDEIDFTSENRLVIWAWHIADEIVPYLNSLGYVGEIWVPLPEFKRIR